MPEESEKATDFPATAASVANTFLEFAAQDPGYSQIDQMKLQKLLFYANAWYLANTNKALFKEEFEAWPWGPVVRSIYQQTAQCGRKPIQHQLSDTLIEGDDKPVVRFETAVVKDNDLRAFLKAVWEAHKSLSGIQLSNATHAPGEPWTVVRDAWQGDLESKPVIPHSLIASIFRKKIES